jgi:hypothetical protein
MGFTTEYASLKKWQKKDVFFLAAINLEYNKELSEKIKSKILDAKSFIDSLSFVELDEGLSLRKMLPKPIDYGLPTQKELLSMYYSDWRIANYLTHKIPYGLTKQLMMGHLKESEIVFSNNNITPHQAIIILPTTLNLNKKYIVGLEREIEFMKYVISKKYEIKLIFDGSKEDYIKELRKLHPRDSEDFLNVMLPNYISSKEYRKNITGSIDFDIE